ncbi:hypothetical protein [Pseudomonas aeruginosa]|uniref:hypothetical protein n=1 Tax=Pseudomonas aeruginosa TaxID=287 RepID=UPI00339BC542
MHHAQPAWRRNHDRPSRQANPSPPPGAAEARARSASHRQSPVRRRAGAAIPGEQENRDAQPSQKTPENVDLLKQLAQAQARIAELEAELASRVTKKEEAEAKTWAIQERKGKARWQTISKGLTRKAGERQFDKLLSGLTDPRYTYRMIEE